MKKLLAIVISMAMVVAMMPMGVFGSSTTTCSGTCAHEAAIGNTHYDTLEEAINAVAAGNSSTNATEIKLIGDDDIKIDGDIAGGNQIISKSVKIDMNGYNVTFAKDWYFLVYNGKLELTGSGTVIGDKDTVAPVVVVSDHKNTRTKGFSTVVVDENVTLEGYNGLAIEYLPENSGNFGPHAYGVNVIVKGKLISNHESNTNPKLDGCGITINGDIEDASAGEGGALPSITLDGAEIISSGCGIYAAGYAEWTLKGNTKIEADDPISVKSGKLTIENGTYTAEGRLWGGYDEHIARNNNSVAAYSNAASGSEPTGAALSITTSNGYVGNIDITIEGGTFTSANNSAVYEGIGKKTAVINGGTESYNETAGANASGLTNLSITGGTFTGANDKDAIAITAATNKKVITAGTFSFDPTEYTNSKCIKKTTAESKSTWTLKKSHTLKDVSANAATCTTAGNNAYKKCSECSKVFEPDGTTETTVTAKTITKKGHTLVPEEGKAATCTEDGWNAYYKCTNVGCNKYFSDGNGNDTIADIEAWKTGAGKIDKLGHSLKSVEAKAATYTEAGNNAYYTCTRDCGKYFSDAEGKTEIAKDSWVIDKLKYVSKKTNDEITNKAEDKDAGTAASTTATVKPETTTSTDGNKTVTVTVNETKANEIVEDAISNGSKEIVIESAASVTETPAGTITEVVLPASAIADISSKAGADVIILSDAAKITLDKEAVKAVADQAGTAGTVKLVIEVVKQDADIVQVDLKIVTSNGTVTDFKGGNVTVTVKLDAELAAKELVCVYIDDNGIYHRVNGTKNADGTFTFTTGHFSTYAVMPADDVDKIMAEQAKDLVKDISLKVKTSKTSKKNIKVTVSGDVSSLTDAGYTVKYRFCRSTKKTSKYLGKITKDTNTYINTKGIKGVKYYYRAKVYVYDGDTRVAKTKLVDQCKYGARTWSK